MRRAIFDTLTAATVASLLTAYYREGLSSYFNTLKIPDYSYLIVLIPTSLYVLDRLLLRSASLSKIDVFTLLSAIGSVFLSVSIYMLSGVVSEYSLQLEVLSGVIFIVSILLFIYGEFNSTIVPLFIWILLLALIPIPRSFIDRLAILLTKPMATAATSLAGGELIESMGYIYIAVKDNLGIERRFFISPECSGIISLLSVASLMPIIIYIVSSSKASFSRKVLSFIYSTVTAIIITLSGNVLRISTMIYITKTISYSTAMEFFHKLPSLVYTGIATVAAIYIAIKMTPPKVNTSNNPKPDISKTAVSVIGSDVMKILSVTILVLFFASLFQITAPGSPIKNGFNVDSDLLLNNPEKIVFNSTELNISYTAKESPLVGEALGALNVHSIYLKWKNVTATGWVEVAETPSRFHGWQVCLSLQGYRIEKWWTESRNLTITYAVVSKGSQRLLLAYTIVRYPTDVGSLYVKISLFTYVGGGNYQKKAQELATLLDDLDLPSQPPDLISNSIKLLYIGLAIMLFASIGGLIYKARTHIKLQT